MKIRKVKKTVSTSLLAMIVVLMSISVAAAVPWEGSLIPQNSAGSYGENTPVELWVTYNSTGLTYGALAYQVDIHFDPGCVNITAANYATSPFTGHMFTPYAPGVTRILEENYTSMVPISSGTYRMAVLTFNGKCTSSCNCNIWFDTNVVSDTDGNPIANNYTNGTYTCTAALVKPDLLPTKIKSYHFEWWDAYNVPKGDPWFNLTNYVNVTVNNTGAGSASGFKVKLYADAELIGEKTISGLSAGSSAEEKFEWKPTGTDPMSWVDTAQGSKVTYTTTDRTYTLKAVVDEANEVPEENETNNNLTKSQKVVWNGYTGDQPLQNYMHGSVKGGMFYTTGDGAYQGVGNAGTTYGTYYNVSYNLEIPGTPKLSRLYIYYTWAQSPTYPHKAPKMGVTLTTASGAHTLSMDKGYNDYKGEFGIWNYPWGTYAYNITDYVTAGGSYQVSITNLNGGGDGNFATKYAFAAPAILTVYENTSMPLREYWINEGADILLGGRRGDGGFLAWWECMNNATFPGSVSLNNATLGIVSPWADSGSDDEVYFNDHSLGRGIYTDWNNAVTLEKDGLKMVRGINTQVSIYAGDVTSTLATSNNRLTQADDGDNMMPVNAFLLVNAAEGVPDFGISVSPGSASVIKGGSTNATVTLTSILGYDKNVTLGASWMPLNTTISFTPEKGKPTPTFTSAMLVKTDNTTPLGSHPITINGTGDDGKVHSTIFTLKVTTAAGGANASVSLRTNIIPAIAIEVTPSSINFGELSPGETSGGKNLTVKNKGGYSINVSAEVTDNSTENLFVRGVLLNESLWNLYSAVIPKNGNDKPAAKLHVPDDYAGAGSKVGTMMFWARKS